MRMPARDLALLEVLDTKSRPLGVVCHASYILSRHHNYSFCLFLGIAITLTVIITITITTTITILIPFLTPILGCSLLHCDNKVRD